MLILIRPYGQDYEKDITCPSPDAEWQQSYHIVLRIIFRVLCISCSVYASEEMTHGYLQSKMI